MARRTKEDLHIYFLTMDFSDINPKYLPLDERKGNIIQKAISKYNKNNVFEIVNCNEIYKECVGANPNEKSPYSPYTLLRLIVNKIPNVPEKLIYLDCDTMVCGDIKTLYDIDMTGHEFGVVKDVMGHRWLAKNYFNAGVMLLNIPEIEKTGIFEKSLKIIKEKRLLFSDQTVLNDFKTNFMFLPNGYIFNEQRKIKKDTVVKHFCQGIYFKPFPMVLNIKQWEIEKVHKLLKINTFDEDYEVYNKIMKEINDAKAKRTAEENKEYIISIQHLCKNYGNLKAVNDISLKVKRGSLFAFLGVNGAGKSTTINIIAQILKKDSGKVLIDGYNLEKYGNLIKKEVGIVFQNSVLDGTLSVEQNLKIRANFYGLSKEEKQQKLERVYNLLDLKPILKQPVKKLSGGQRRRVDIARSMIHDPKILILDEPTTGLDPQTRISVWSLIDKIREETGMTVFLTTHYLEEAEKASDVVIMDHGVIIAEGTPVDLKNMYSKNYLLVYSPKTDLLDKEFSEYNTSYNEDAACYKIVIKDVEDVFNILKEKNKVIKDFEVKKGDMDDVFLTVTGRKHKDEEEK